MRAGGFRRLVSMSWNMKQTMGAIQKPNGEYDRPYSDGINNKRIRTNLWPKGKFNQGGDGPLASLQNVDNDMSSMTKNLSTNQTVAVLYINIPRFVVPIVIPNIYMTGQCCIAKCIDDGDVVFQLRYNEAMLSSGNATQVCTRYMPDLVYCSNLATTNYILFGIQTMLAEVWHAVRDSDSNIDFYRAWINLSQRRNGAAPPQATEMAFDRYFKFVNYISYGKFDILMKDFFFDDYSRRVNVNSPEEEKVVAYRQHINAFLWDFINTYCQIGGIFVGSDQQGGAHYGNPNPASRAPSDFVGVLQVAGKNFKARNMWSACQGGTSSGDILGFKLKHIPSKPAQAHLQGSIGFRLSSNPGTQVEQVVVVSQKLVELGGFSLLMPAKQRAESFNPTGVPLQAFEEDDGFLQFAICDQMSKPSNIHNGPITTACDATAAIVPAPIQIFMRIGFTRLNKTSNFPSKKEALKLALDAVVAAQNAAAAALIPPAAAAIPPVVAAILPVVAGGAANIKNDDIETTTKPAKKTSQKRLSIPVTQEETPT